MGHLHTDIMAKGDKAKEELKGVLVDTGATYTVLPENTLKKIGASRIPTKVIAMKDISRRRGF